MDASGAAYVLLFGRLTLGLAFSTSGIAKVANVVDFAQAIRGFGVLPGRLAMPLAVGVIVGEFATAVGLLSGLGVQMAAMLALFPRTVYSRCSQCTPTSAPPGMSMLRPVICAAGVMDYSQPQLVPRSLGGEINLG